ncbi:hypothetical protein UY3_19261 [Chelonia mydas]|uniref:Uncharacterized protein n=1 Tax=Chelonia mydas TaxID=8469 RepID=M7AH72_CHEMY|nr:hypothetical protein UY3_19261 [Chelonia mydas]
MNFHRSVSLQSDAEGFTVRGWQLSTAGLMLSGDAPGNGRTHLKAVPHSQSHIEQPLPFQNLCYNLYEYRVKLCSCNSLDISGVTAGEEQIH